jgi:hypothetical protein
MACTFVLLCGILVSAGGAFAAPDWDPLLPNGGRAVRCGPGNATGLAYPDTGYAVCECFQCFHTSNGTLGLPTASRSLVSKWLPVIAWFWPIRGLCA